MAVETDRDLIQRLAAIVGEAGVDTAEEALIYFSEDALRGRGRLTEQRPEPQAVVRPASAEQTAAVLALATRLGLPVVPYGAGTGLMGGARSGGSGIVLDTVRLDSIDVHPDDRLVWAGSGCILERVDDALRPHGLCIGHDPWTFPVATVGGTLSTNGLGYRGGRYGGMGDQAIALEVALADGTVLRTKAVRRHSTGPNLARLFIGAEGTLGVITAAALQAHRRPERQELRAFQFPDFESGFQAIQGIAALGLRPSLLDYGEEHASPWPNLADREEEQPLLYLGFEGLEEEVEMSLRRAASLIASSHGEELDPEAAREFWEERHVIAQRFVRGKPRQIRWGSADAARDYMHVALPPSRVLEFRAICHETCEREQVGLLECGLWTAPDFFSAVFLLPNALGGQERLNAVTDGLLRRAQDLGGSMEYVHGAGLRLAHLMQREHGTGHALLRRLKATLDPANILNPGKLDL